MDPGLGGTRERIVAAASRLLSEGGREAVTTRAVSAAAGVQDPTIYRLFGDKRGLLDAVATSGFAEYLSAKTALKPSVDSVEDLRAGWDNHISFALSNPALYALIYGDPRSGAVPAADAAAAILHEHIARIAEAGRLRVSVERAAQLVHAVGAGTALTLIALADEELARALSDMAREAVIAAVTSHTAAVPKAGPANAAVALRAALGETTALTPHENALMKDWLDRIANTDHREI